MRLLLFLALLAGCALDDDELERLSTRFTHRPITVQASAALEDECIESLEDGVLFYRAREVSIALVVVDPGAASVNGIQRHGVIGVYRGATQYPDSLAETKRAKTILGNTVAADIVLKTCDARAIAHELGHALGLVDNYEPGNLMHKYLGLGGWSLTNEQLFWIAD